MTSGRTVPVSSLLTVFSLAERSSKDLSLLLLASSSQHDRSPKFTETPVGWWEGKKCSLTGLAFLCIFNKSLDSRTDRSRFVEVVD